MLKLDHLTVIAPTLIEGVSHVRNCLGLDIPFGTRHSYMGTHNHRLQLGDSVYLEIVSLDPKGMSPGRSRWFGLDNQETVRSNWDEGRCLRGWVASTVDIAGKLANHQGLFGDRVPLPFDNPKFDFSIPFDGSLPMEGAIPSLIDHRDNPTPMTEIPDLSARFLSFTLEHPEPTAIAKLYKDLALDRPPEIVTGPQIRYRAQIKTPAGVRTLT